MWRYYRIAVAAVVVLMLTHIVSSCVIRKAEIDELMREQEEAEVPLWAQH